ncbi:MAG TPA: hypothetical protein VF393_06490 [archaeon]
MHCQDELLEIHRSKISVHHAKAGYHYPTIQLPLTFSKLAGLSTRIYQTIYDGLLAFLKVISPTKNASKHPKPPSSHSGDRGVRIAPGTSFLFEIGYTRDVRAGFLGYEDYGEKQALHR